MMKVVIFALLLGCAASAEVNPVSRVTGLLRNLAKQIEKEGEKEESLYETFVCWGKSVIEQKTAANAAADTRIDVLETYIADLESGRIELTSERSDLEKEIEELSADMEVATDVRKKENADFLDAKDEMTKARNALSSAIKVLGDATKNHKEGVLVAMKSQLNGGMANMLEQQASLKHAVTLGDRFLGKADATFLRRLLLGDVPKVDWKKLNRKATFKMAYKARSGKIQDVLAKLHQTFVTNLNDATTKESDAKTSYDALSKSKQGQLDTAQGALTKMESENGANGMSKQDSKDEAADLKKQVTADEKFIKDTEKALEDKAAAWKVRQGLRAGELEAISKAVSILASDDSRDLFKKSGASQGFLFLQTNMASEAKLQAAKGAASALREAAKRSGDDRLLALAASLASPSVKTQFGPVLAAVDKMIAILKGNEKSDLEIKQGCEADRMVDTQKSIVASREIDDATDTSVRLAAEIKTLEGKIADLAAEHKKVADELAAATAIRKDANAAWKVADEDDRKAAATVFSASVALQKFYKDNKLALTQEAKQPATEAGEAPPPPPATWEGGYGGKKGESQGIVAILDMVRKDILKDQATGKSEEQASQTEYDAFKKDSEKELGDLMNESNQQQKVKGNKGTKLTDTKKMRGTTKGNLNALLKKMEKINPNCEYFEVNYPMRVENRKIEIDGLEKAKAILKGGKFDKGPDPDREMTVGDAASAI